MNSATLASRLKITPKQLRRLLRKEGYAKTDGRYNFTEADFEKLHESLTDHASIIPTEIQGLNGKGLPVSSLNGYWSSPELRAQHKALSTQRRARLLERLNALQNV